MAPFEKNDGVVITHHWLAPVIVAASCASLAVVFAVVFVQATSFSVIASFAILGFAAARMWGPLERKGIVRADRSGLFLGAARIAGRGGVQSASTRFTLRGRVVHLRLGVGQHVEIVMSSRDEARALLCAMALDERGYVAKYWTYDRRVRMAAIAAIAAAVLVALVFGKAVAVALALLATAIAFGPIALGMVQRLAIGADGVTIRRLYAPARFIPYDAMALAKSTRSDVVLAARNGTKLTITTTSGETADAIVSEINDRRAAARHVAPTEIPAALRRDRRPVGAWLGSVASPAHVDAYRTAMTPPDVLWRIVEDPTAQPTARAAAAYVLRRDAAGFERDRVVRIAEACAAPKLRVALEIVASSEDDQSVARALEPLEDFPDEPQAKSGMAASVAGRGN